MGADEPPVISVRTRLGVYSGLPFYRRDSYTISAATTENAENLALLEREIFPAKTYGNDVLDQKKFTYFLTRANAATLIARDKKQIIGYALLLFRSNSNVARLYSIGLSPKHQSHGAGRFIMQSFEAFCNEIGIDKITLETHKSNISMQKLCESEGYKMAYEISNYYADGSAALKYKKHIGLKGKTR